MFVRGCEHQQLEWDHRGSCATCWQLGGPRVWGQLLGRLRVSPRPVTGVSIFPLCVRTHVHILLKDFHRDQRGAGGGCWCCLCFPKCWVCIARCGQPGTYVLCTCFCVCTYRERVLNFAPGLGLGAALPLLGCWIRQLRIKGCGSEKRCWGSLKNLSLLKLTEHLRAFTSGDTDFSFQMYCVDEKDKKFSSIVE